MKRYIMLCLVICLFAVFMTGCRNSDYEQAQALYNSGEYEQARALFEELADYKDSPRMTVQCTYSQAQSLYKKEAYIQARSLFEEVSDFEDSQKMVLDCTYCQAKALLKKGEFQQAEVYLQELGDYEDTVQLLKSLPEMQLMHYLENEGDLVTRIDVSSETHYIVTVRKLTKDTVEFTYDLKGRNSTVTSDTMVTMILELGQPKLIVKGTHSMTINFLGKLNTDEESAEGQLDIRTYRYGDEMLWDKYYFKGYDVNGKPLDPNVNGFFLVASNAPLERTFQAAEAMLQENQVGVTLHELGFASLK